ncbi:hypothetical protein QFZ82_001110 [Streptomyces sp. V4I23]|uniref:hypothetical protein n=1 Tax=Streptomyces sp. V4I23 TaxID=3042282 RepID=UPI002781D1C2|nr:hypothetical protein [Streptomyces sp. V4I23]MDQ1006625.1 hypothetical protein [Streptomyces sp. V4I23]
MATAAALTSAVERSALVRTVIASAPDPASQLAAVVPTRLCRCGRRHRWPPQCGDAFCHHGTIDGHSPYRPPCAPGKSLSHST